ncbi:hypothetical protein GMOD_00008634 [Pyrenophora seminiperda CCB06]|uniref:Bacteriophage T5 Orf172 DNA-binding domain-containing protein n=1 Tax=Pyrenophora seminiperda CCB06 TaxID=1302712 RepID=A0A3M7M988_9PLEO|nr:hypothetical protein GMOD_00008634 [Pyrenophora seminiperda CCB06]
MFTGRTPESLIPRSDSRNPATTCKGITKSGRPCRRPIDAKASNNDDGGVIAVVSVEDDSDEEEIGAAAYFCWQHKDQAERLAAQASSGPATQLYPLKERNSIDTLVERLGVLDVDEPGEAGRQPKEKRTKNEKRASGSTSRPPRRINRPPTWGSVQGPLMSVPSDVMAQQKHQRPSAKPAPQRKKQSFWASLCCGSADHDDEDDFVEASRHKRRPNGHSATKNPSETPMQQIPAPPRVQPNPSSRRRSSNPTTSKPPSDTPQPSSKTSRTTLQHYIPSTLPPSLAATLLAELSKPISPHDDSGYIYIFWLTPDSAGPAPAATASSLLAPPTAAPGGRRGAGAQNRRTSDVMRQFSVKAQGGGGSSRSRAGSAAGGNKGVGVEKEANKSDKEPPTILLKIGRANNVHRRMNEWSRQCGYSLSLVRYYPYVPSSTPSPSPSPSPSRHTSPDPSTTNGGVRKVPHAMRVERLIHLELAAQRVIKQCEACGKSHKEWFEVEASREGIKRVDGVVRRWVGWAEGGGGGEGGGVGLVWEGKGGMGGYRIDVFQHFRDLALSNLFTISDNFLCA